MRPTSPWSWSTARLCGNGCSPDLFRWRRFSQSRRRRPTGWPRRTHWHRPSRSQARERHDPQDGLVKVLDFGLAKSAPAAALPSDATQAPTQTGLTEPGVVLGTVGYMSPEQAMGKPADLHSDQFSLGAILYEMATGSRASSVRRRSRPSRRSSATSLLRSANPGPTFRSRSLDHRALSRQGVGSAICLDEGPRARSRTSAREAADASTPPAAVRRKPASRALALGALLATVVAAALLISRGDAAARPGRTVVDRDPALPECGRQEGR